MKNSDLNTTKPENHAEQKEKDLEKNENKTEVTSKNPQNHQLNPSKDQKETKEKSKPPKTFRQKLKSAIKNISVEPIMFLLIVPSCMASLATENLNLEKSCRVNNALDPSVCDAMMARNNSGFSAADEIVVQKLVTKLLAIKTAIQGFVPFLLMLFLGSWSDRHGKRKPFILLPVLGELTSCLGYFICTYFFTQLSVEYAIFFEAVPPAITGGWFCFFVGVYSYVSGKCKVESRTFRIGILAMVTHVSVTIGIALSGVTYKALGFYGVYSLALGMYITALIYGIYVIKDEPLEDQNLSDKEKKFVYDPVKKKGFLADLFDFQHVVDTWSICFKEGPNNRKKKILAIVVLVFVIVGPHKGELSVMYMFTRRKFTWDEIDYSAFNTFHCVTQLLGALICLLFFCKLLKVGDATLGIIAMTSKIFGCLVYGFAPTTLYFYLGSVVEILNGSNHIALRSLMSKLVEVNELGQTNSIFGMCEALTPLLFGPLYSFTYNYFIAFYPSAFYFVSCAFQFVAFLIFGWLHILYKKEEKLKAIENGHSNPTFKPEDEITEMRRKSIILECTDINH